MTAAKIRLLFAVFSVCFVIFYIRSVSSCSASSSDDCTKLVGESHPDSSWLLCLLHEQHQRLQICVVIQYLALPRGPLDDRGDQTNQLHWLELLHTSYISLLNQAGKGRVFYPVDKCFQTGADPRNIIDKQI